MNKDSHNVSVDTRKSTSHGKAALAGILGALAGIALTPFMAAVWEFEPGVDWSEKTLVTRTLGPTLESSGLLTFGPEGLPYELYSKGFFLVYLLMIPVIRLVRPYYHQRTGWTSQLSIGGWRVMFWAALVAAAGDFLSYWGKSVPGIAGDQLWSFGFLVELLAIAALLISTVVFSISAWKGRVISAWTGVLLLAGMAALLPVNIFITQYAPNSVVVPLSIAWAAIGITLWFRRSQPELAQQLT